MSQSRPVAPLATVLKSRLRQPQFYWFLGHFLTLYYYARYCLSFSQRSIRYNYPRVLFFISLTYGIVLYQFYKSGQLTLKTVRQQLRTLDNLQYFGMALVLFACSSAHVVFGALSSPVIFSLFHSLNYFKENLLPFLPVAPMLKAAIADRIAFFITHYNEKFLVFAHNFEITAALQCGLSVPGSLAGCLIRFNTARVLRVVSIYAYIFFFKLRYTQSPQMKTLFQQHYVARADAFIQARLPQFWTKWHGLKLLVATLFDRIPL
ncbi:LAMI_0G17084g1_1 [Lachancea mirantina]|uniref:LAMI_0G17084g1_1 n=1 Tax=Lachancea mirantina TaxID=1230905 RepID=A0A1G4KCR4_9SACH|nr:LAMI_0G17084g1_1 [Lachancea mirantina]